MPTEKMGSSFLKKFDGVIVVFDVTNLESFKNVDKWLEKLTKQKDHNSMFYILGNK